MSIRTLLISILSIQSIAMFGQKDYPYEYLSDIRNNLLSYRIHYLTNAADSEYDITYKCLLPSKSEILDISVTRTDLPFPNKTYDLYEVINNGYVYKEKRGDSLIVENKRGCGFVPYSQKSLIAYKKGSILYISGMLFKDPISRYFDLNEDDPKTFDNFLRLKLYNYNIKDFKFVRRARKHLIFKNEQHSIRIKVSRENFDLISLKRS